MNSNLRIVEENEPISLEEILAFEKKFNMRLPSEYQEFLLKKNGGKMYYNSFDRYLKNGDILSYSIDFFESISSIEEGLKFLKEDEYFTSAGIVPVAQTLGSTLVGIGYHDHNLGKIFVFDWDFGATFQAKSITKFIEQIKYDS